MFDFSSIDQAWHEYENLSVVHCNIRSARRNLDQFCAHLSRHSFVYDVIALTETWLKDGESAHVPGYTLLSLPRKSSSRGGGVALFLKKASITSACLTTLQANLNVKPCLCI